MAGACARIVQAMSRWRRTELAGLKRVVESSEYPLKGRISLPKNTFLTIFKALEKKFGE
jgi:hypothetical protein